MQQAGQAYLLFQRVSVHFEIQFGGRLGEESRGRLRCPRLSLGWSSEEPDSQRNQPRSMTELVATDADGWPP